MLKRRRDTARRMVHTVHSLTTSCVQGTWFWLGLVANATCAPGGYYCYMDAPLAYQDELVHNKTYTLLVSLKFNLC